MIFRLMLDPGESADERAIVIGDLVETLVIRNLAWLAKARQTPPLALFDVAYIADPSIWRDIPTMIATRQGDCKDLSAWRIAELRAAGVDARAHVEIRETQGEVATYHVAVRRADGVLEDPSREKGMGA